MIFHKVECEPVVQVNDKFRISLLGVYATPDEGEIIKYELSFDDVNYFDITAVDDFYLDWEFQTAGTKTIYTRISTTLTTDDKSNFTIEVIDESTDKLFHSEEDIKGHEPEIYCFLPDGKSSFKNIARCVQKNILDWLDLHEYRINEKSSSFCKSKGRKIEKEDIHDVSQVRLWSTYETLKLIYEGISRGEESYKFKADYYAQKAMDYAKRDDLLLDTNQDGIEDEVINTSSINIVRKL